MKVTKLTIKNIGLIADETIPFDKPLILFFGDIQQGKSTILNAVKWNWGGSFPQDIIRHGQNEASIESVFDRGSIKRTFYRSKDGATKAREIDFILDGHAVKRPAEEIKKLLNPFQLDQDHLKNKNETDRKLFFTELFAVDTTALDAEWALNDRKASDLRIKIKGYGDIDLNEVKPVDIGAARTKLAEIRANYHQKKSGLDAKLSEISQKHEADIAAVDAVNDAAREHNNTVDQHGQRLASFAVQISELEKRLVELRSNHAASEKWLKANPKQELKPKPQFPAGERAKIQSDILALAPDTTALEAQIQEAGATNVRAEQYAANKAKADRRKVDEKSLSDIEKRQREIKTEKAGKLKTISDTSGIEGLAFDEDGNFSYKGCAAGMLSTSQIMELSSKLSAMYPDGFGIELLDRGESLGKSIFGFVERAKREEKTILATIVGERPADVPDEIGVFVVTKGKVTQ